MVPLSDWAERLGTPNIVDNKIGTFLGFADPASTQFSHSDFGLRISEFRRPSGFAFPAESR
jgi:hypothetical protein